MNECNDPGVNVQIPPRADGGNRDSADSIAPFQFLGDGLFLTGCFAYALNRWVLKPHLHNHFLHDHFNDLWLIPCALPPLLWVHWKLRMRPAGPPTFLEIISHLVLWSVLFEWIGPKFWPRATADPWDLACYWLGGAVAWLWWHRKSLRRT